MPSRAGRRRIPRPTICTSAGLVFAGRRTPETTRRAIDYFSQATAQDPDYALAWVAIATAYAGSELNGDAPPREVLPRAQEAVAHAVRADPNLSETQYAAGYVSWCCEWDWAAAETWLRRALDLNPRLALAHLHLGHALSQMGRHDEARQAIDRARALDPLEPLVHALSSQVTFQARDYEAALTHAQQALALDRQFWIGYMMRAQAHEQRGELDLALDALGDGARFSGQQQQDAVAARLRAREGRPAQRGPRRDDRAGGRFQDEVCAAVRVCVDPRRVGRSGRGFRVARARLRGARRPPDLSDRRREVGSVSTRSALRGPARARGLPADSGSAPIRVYRPRFNFSRQF